MKVAITGISGYIASVVADYFINDNTVEEIIGIDVKPPVLIKSNKLTFVKMDVRDEEVERVFKNVDVVVHLAFIVSPNVPYKEIDSINIGGSKNVFLSAAKSGVKQIIYTSSIAAYGADPRHRFPLTEDAPRFPNKEWYYSKAKGEIEDFLDKFEKEHPDLSITRLRPAILLGPNINNFFGKILKSKILVILANDVKIEWVWDNDVARAIYLAYKKGIGGVFNIGGGDCLTLSEIARHFHKKAIRIPGESGILMLKYLAKFKLINRGYYDWFNLPMKYPICMDSSKAGKVLGWEPEFNSLEAIEKFLSDKP